MDVPLDLKQDHRRCRREFEQTRTVRQFHIVKSRMSNGILV